MKIQFSVYDWMQHTPGFLQILKTAKLYLGSWGIIFDSLQQAFLDTLTNRLAKNTSDSGTALIEEFGLPGAEVLTYKKWIYSSQRGTKQGIFNMMNDLGHPNVSIYSGTQRFDSPFMTYSTSNFPTSLTRYSTNSTAFSQFDTFYSETQSTNAYYDSSGLSNSWYTVVVWDCYAPANAMQLQGNVIQGSGPLGWNNPNQPISNTPGSQVDPTYNYFGLTNQSVLMDVARWGKNIKNVPMELILCYPSISGAQPQSLINSSGEPVQTPSATNSWTGDVIEYLRLNIDENSAPQFQSTNTLNSSMFGPTGSLVGTTLLISTDPNVPPVPYALSAADCATQTSFLNLFGTPTNAATNSLWPGLFAFADSDSTLILQTVINASSNYDYSKFIAVYPFNNTMDVNTIKQIKYSINQVSAYTLFEADIDESNNLVIYNYGPYGTSPNKPPFSALSNLLIQFPNMVQSSNSINSLVTFDLQGNLYIFGNLFWTADPYLGCTNEIGLVQSIAYPIINKKPIIVIGEGTANPILGLIANIFE